VKDMLFEERSLLSTRLFYEAAWLYQLSMSRVNIQTQGASDFTVDQRKYEIFAVYMMEQIPKWIELDALAERYAELRIAVESTQASSTEVGPSLPPPPKDIKDLPEWLATFYPQPKPLFTERVKKSPLIRRILTKYGVSPTAENTEPTDQNIQELQLISAKYVKKYQARL